MNQQYLAAIRKELRIKRWSILAYCVIAAAFVWMYIGIFPSFQKESAKFNELLEAYPKALLEAFNIEELQISTLEGYIAAEHFSFVWPIMVILLMLSYAGSTIAGEIEKGTMAVLLSLPLTRLKLYWSKYTAGLVILLLFCVASILVVFPIAQITDVDFNAANFWRVGFLSFLFGWAIVSVGFMVASFVSERSTVYFVIGGGLLAMYVINVVSGLVESAEKLKYASIFNYYVPSDALVKGELDMVSMAVLGGLAIASAVVGAVAFSRRDISV